MLKTMLIITKHLDIGGTEKMLLRILPAWISMGFKIDILYTITLLVYPKNGINVTFHIFIRKRPA